MDNKNAVTEATKVITDAEARTCTFTKTYKVHGHNKTGTFTFKYPSLMDRVQIGVARAKLLDGASEQSLDTMTSDLTFMMAYLGKLCIKQPKWFNINMIDEFAVLSDLYNEVSKWVSNFRQEMDASEDAGHSDTANDEADMDGYEVV